MRYRRSGRAGEPQLAQEAQGGVAARGRAVGFLERADRLGRADPDLAVRLAGGEAEPVEQTLDLGDLSAGGLLPRADAEVAVGLAGVQRAQAPWWPQLDLLARASADRSIEVLGERTLLAEALAPATWNLYRGGGDSALLRQAEAELAATRLDRAERRRSVEEEVRVAYRALVAAEAIALPLQRHADAAQQVLVAYGQQFDIGRRSLLDLLDAQGELTAARLRAADTQYRLLLAHYELAYALGALTATLGLAAPVP